ncbi:hypothetical protein B0H14DRAFT_3144540 [Mycena olivaceomarginata]|nr:hypothetical protein B0H14DRAFT_3144540 [Mycena olivaceomarginata]
MAPVRKDAANHRKSPKHASALRATAGPTPSGPTLLQPPVPKDPLRPAVMTLAAHYADDPLDSDEDMPLAGISGMEHGRFSMLLGNKSCFLRARFLRWIALSSESNRIWREMENLGYYDHTIFTDMTPMMADIFDKTDDCTVSDAVRAMAAMGEYNMVLMSLMKKTMMTALRWGVFNEDWVPHSSKTMFMLDLLDNLPHLRLSDDQLKAIIWVMKECGTPNVPSFSTLRKMQKKMTQDIVSESWQAEKYVKEIEDDDLSPMWANWDGASHRHFYIKELAQSKDGKYHVPLKWIIYKKQVHCDAYLVTKEMLRNMNDELKNLKVVRVLATDFLYNFLDLRAQGEIKFSGVQDAFTPHTPHPVREIAQGRPVFVLRIMPWADDVSGNRSKQYNAHMNMYIANINLPHQLLSQEYFVRFCATSQKIGLRHTIANCSRRFYSELGFIFSLRIIPNRLKPRQLLVQVPIFGVGRTIAEGRQHIAKQRRDTMHSFQDPRLNDPRIKNEARQLVKQGIIKEIQEELLDWVIMQPPEHYEKLDEQTRINPELRLGDHYNVLLRLCGLDPHRDSPCEILHTVLLREDKYVWYKTTKGWNDEQGEIFAARLQSASIDGLNLPPLRAQYMVQYKKSLIGKHYKALQQVGIFQLDAQLCSPALFELWKANGVLGALIWFPVIKNMDQYLADLTVVIDNVLDRWAIVDPTKITQKYKLHVLPHLPSAVRRFGPSVLFATEIFECWNTVFRLCSVLSNHQAPSLDIATTLADMECFKHQVSSGWWKPVDGDWTQAGRKFQTFLTGNQQLQRRIGWTSHDTYKAGSVMPVSKSKQRPNTWKNALGSAWNNTLAEPISHANKNWIACSWVFIMDGVVTMTTRPSVHKSATTIYCSVYLIIVTIVKFKRFGVVNDPCVPTRSYQPIVHVLAARIIKILTPEHTQLHTAAIIVLQMFTVSETIDDHYGMPLLVKTENTVVSRPEHILFKFNAQHDCHHFSCPLADSPGPQQERSESKLTRKVRAHKDESRFLLNTHALHNAHLVRETLPRSLTAPKPCFVDRRAKHSEFAAALQAVGPEKRAQATARGQATKARNKQDKVDKAAGVAVRAGDPATNIK